MDFAGVSSPVVADGKVFVVSGTFLSLRESAKATEQGGLSGRPLFALSTRMLAETFVRVEGAFPLIGAGGIDSGAAAFAKIKAGANLLQLYSGLIFRGVGLIRSIKQEPASSSRSEEGCTTGRHSSWARGLHPRWPSRSHLSGPRPTPAQPSDPKFSVHQRG